MDCVGSELVRLAEACRQGFLGLAEKRGSTFEGFPRGACGVASDIVGRVIWEVLGREGVYVCGSNHPQLGREASHAWFEVGELIVDVTHDQFSDTGLVGWVFMRGEGWHSRFKSVSPRAGYCSPSDWPAYPNDGYLAAAKAAKAAGFREGADS